MNSINNHLDILKIELCHLIYFFHKSFVRSLYSDEDGLLSNYGLTKVIDSTPNVRLHVVNMPEACSSPNNATRPVCCRALMLKMVS